MRPKTPVPDWEAAGQPTNFAWRSIMKRTTKIALAVGTALSLGLGVAAVSAHPYGDSGYGAGPGYGMGYGMHGYGPGYGPQGYGMGPGWGMHGYGMGPQGMFGGYPGGAEERLTELKSELGITAKQEATWQAFAKSAKQRDESREAWFAKMREARAAGSLPERLAQQDEAFKQHQAERQAMTSALKKLYAALTPEQKAIADQRLGGFGPGYGAGYGRGYGGGRFR
jgi:hypothetical protein